MSVEVGFLCMSPALVSVTRERTRERESRGMSAVQPCPVRPASVSRRHGGQPWLIGSSQRRGARETGVAPASHVQAVKLVNGRQVHLTAEETPGLVSFPCLPT